MPYVHIQTSAAVSEQARERILAQASRIAAEAIGKPESYVMVSLSEASMLMGGKSGPTAFCDVRSIGGLGSRVNAALSAKLCALLSETLDVPADRVFLNFSEFEAGNWGWNGGTFG
ncbi:MAG: phenylpyruvate tautomerase MIF-related protein [Myxococcales bacterium]|jgi:phenylpyruvate tautomerase